MAGDVRPMEFRLLGRPEVLVDGRVVPIGSLQQRAILVALVLAGDGVVSSDELADVVWGEHPPASAAKTLQGLVWRLRKHLSGVDLGGCDEGYRLVAGADAVDARRFERLVMEGRGAAEQSRTEAAAAAFEAALALWRGPALGEFATWPFAQAEAVRLEEARLAAVEDLAEAELLLGRTASALARLEPVVHRWPLRERAVGQLMLGLYRTRRQADALAAYQRLRRTLAEELGLEPTPGLRELEAAILRHSDELVPATRLPSQTWDRPRHNLPTALTPFVGRASELVELQALLADSRLVTLTGPGGAGKTRLALEVASAVRDRFPDGVWLADLAAVADGAMVAPTIAAGVGLLVAELAQPDGDLAAALTERLRNRRLLVVLDNCEHLIAAAAATVHLLLQSCPGLAILATTRESLSVTGEVVFAVPPLSLPPGDPSSPAQTGAAESLLRFDAVALFCTRAHAADRTFALSETNADAVVGICRRLDGLPLALELAAARARVLGTKELARQLDDRFAALGEGPRTAPRRQQTLRATLDWSHDLLTPAEQAVLHRLAVFPATFDLDAVQAVAGTEAVAPFIRLVDKSLVTVVPDDSGVRYQLLESVRAYGLDKLASVGDVAEAQRAHRDAFLARAMALVDDGEGWLAECHRRLHTDYTNFLAALEWSWANGDHDAAVWICAALTNYWLRSGHPEACEWMERAAGVPMSSPAMARPAALTRGALAFLLRNFRGYDEGRATALIADAIEVAEAGSDPFSRAWVRIRAVDHALVTGHLDDAREHIRRGDEDFRSVGPLMEAAHGVLRALVAMAAGDLDTAAQAFERPLQILAAAPDNYLGPWTQSWASLLRAQAGDPSARGLAAETVAASRRLPAPYFLVMALARAAEAAILLGTADEAQPLVVELVEALRQLGARRWVAEAYELAAIVFGEDRPETAAVALGAAERLRTALGEPPGPTFLLGEALEATTDRIRQALGTEQFSLQKARGTALPVDEALALVADRLRNGS